MLSLANIYTLYFRLYFRLCICLNKLSINDTFPIEYGKLLNKSLKEEYDYQDTA